MAGIDQYTVLMLHCDGADTSTTFTDSSTNQAAKTVTAVGNAQIDTAQSKFGGASGLFDGTGDYLTVPDSADWDYGTGNFTIDFWFRVTGVTGEQTFIDSQRSVSTGLYIKLENATNIKTIILNTGHEFTCSEVLVNTWYHLAYVRSGSDLMAFLDGVQQSTTQTDSQDITGSTNLLSIGSTIAGADPIAGWMDEIRVSKGIARWTANFTPSTVAYSVNAGLFGVFDV